MNKRQSFNSDSPDTEGIAALCEEHFVRYRNMLFLHSSFDEAAIDSALQRNLPEHQIQLERNHRDLITYAGTVSEQRKASESISTRWLERLASEFPDLYPRIAVELSNDDVVISLRASQR